MRTMLDVCLWLSHSYIDCISASACIHIPTHMHEHTCLYRDTHVFSLFLFADVARG